MTIIKGVATFKRVIFAKGDFVIGAFEPVSIEEGNIEVNESFGTFSMKGEMPAMQKDTQYHFIAEEGQRHPQYGISYECCFIRQDINLESGDSKDIRSFLEIILTKRQVDSLYEIFENPLAVIKENNPEKLTQANGIGLKTANRILKYYDSQKDYTVAYVELGKFGITPNTIRKIVSFYSSPELAVEKINNNPYELMKIDGYGFKTCDEIFFKMGGDPNDKIRIKSFLLFALQEEAGRGHTWSAPSDLIHAALEFIPTADQSLIGRILIDNEDDEFYLTSDKKRISLKSFQMLEELVAGQLYRVLTANNTFEYDGWEDEVAKAEDKQGWNFTGQQKEAMQMMLENNVSILQGYGGTGKTTSLKAVADILEMVGYIYAQCALSGKASNNLALVTGRESSTIHRLLGFDVSSGGFHYNHKNPLPYDIVIVDEVSMVDARLFGHLLLAVRSGAKLIMLGDSQQLESIGIPVMMPMLDSHMIPTMTLTQIHRQAQKSAVVTDSIAIRQGKQVVKESMGRVVHGELQDLEYELVESDDDIFLNVVREFHKHIQVEDIKDVQILSQTRNKGKNSCLAINKACQKIYNPGSPDKDEIQVGKEDTGYVLRQGDKVINIRNNYQAVDEHDTSCPVFNGNIGILEEFYTDDDGDNYMLIDFEGIGRLKIYEDKYNTIELAYCITVHKSQGSASKIIIVAFPYHFLLNSRQLIYTAITRTRKHCVVIATKKTIVKAIQKDDVSNKRTYLAEYLQSLYNDNKKLVGA